MVSREFIASIAWIGTAPTTRASLRAHGRQRGAVCSRQTYPTVLSRCAVRQSFSFMALPPFFEFRFQADEVFENCNLTALKRLLNRRIVRCRNFVHDFIAQVFRFGLAILHQLHPSRRLAQ